MIERRSFMTTIEQNAECVKQTDVAYRPPLDLHDAGDRYELHVDLPGASPDAVDVRVHNGVLTIDARVPDRAPEDAEVLRAEFGVGDFRRQLRLGEDIDPGAVDATFADGVLTLALPKRAERQPRRIAVRSG
jgi:HSP20 family protein